MPPPGLISIIVVNWNGMNYLPECIDSLAGQSYEPKELIIVDNASTDGSLDWLRERQAGNFRLLELPANTGFAGGVNAGIRAAEGEFIALLNNDAVADREWLKQLAAPLSDPSIGMAACKILYYDRRHIIDKAGHLLYPDGLNRGRGTGEPDRGQFAHDSEILFPDGCAALYRRSLADEVGPFDEQFFAYGDDADFGLRARWLGWKCAYASEARVYHRHSSSLGRYSPAKAFLVERNRFWVALKLLPWPLLVASPMFTLWRFLWHAWSVAAGRGLAGGVTRTHSAWSLLAATARAYLSGLAGAGAILRKRRAVFARRQISGMEFYRVLRRYRISARDLAIRD